MAERKHIKIQSVYHDDPERTSWQEGPPAWRQWVEASCKTRDDVIRVLKQSLPVESSTGLGVQFIDADGQMYSVEVRIGPWFLITRWDKTPQGYQDRGPEASFAPQPDLYRLRREWIGQDAEPDASPDHGDR